ncbi:MAG: class I SAM-dependent methyltransferase [Candidatus Margulisbacteria bacterium]|nr:class I SAM-dependent methyltransferase [Candidatus Margulisiibacteriota bacterium]
MTDKKKQIDYFEGLLAKHGESFLALDWNSPESQKLRYKIFKDLFVWGKKSTGISILDVGCGFGDLYGYFKAEKLLGRHKIRYTGYDVSAKLLEVAKKKYPDGRFELKDILEERHLPKFDYVFCSGVFNIRTGATANHLEFVKEMLLRLYDLANYGIGVNFLSEGAIPISVPEDLNSGRYFYFKPEEIMSFCRFISNRFIIRHDYHPGDFTVYLFK